MNSRYDYIGLDASFFRQFCTSSICYTIEDLNLIGMYVSDAAFEELFKNASSMKCLKVLTTGRFDGNKIEMLAESGAIGGWPLLEKLSRGNWRGIVI